jgi:hypothetical protein
MALSAPARFDHTEGTVAVQLMGNRHASVFVGQWAPTLLILGLYNKLVKQLGSDATDRPRLS